MIRGEAASSRRNEMVRLASGALLTTVVPVGCGSPAPLPVAEPGLRAILDGLADIPVDVDPGYSLSGLR